MSLSAIAIRHYYGCVSFFGSINENNIAINQKVYPNPSSGTITLHTGKTKPFRLSVYNYMGALIYESDFSGNEEEILLTPKSEGLLFYSLEFEDHQRITGKFIIAK
jgi:hypothetical protein